MATLGTNAKAIIQLLRIKQWIKNTFLFTPLIFSLNFLNAGLVTKSLLAFLAFCLASSFGYAVNDILDREKDRQHPEKSRRPIARGAVSVPAASFVAGILLAASIALSIVVNPLVTASIAGYIVLVALYSFVLKRLVIIDVMAIALGFVIRVIAGALAIEVGISNWILLCSLFISLFLGFGKRRNELNSLDDAANHRSVLGNYNIRLLDYMIVASLALTIITYSLYVIDPETVSRLGTDKLVMTLPFVIYGVFKYLYRLHVKQDGSDLADIILRDKGIIIDIVLWLLSIVIILYVENKL